MARVCQVRVWNFSNGQCLQELRNHGQLEVSSVAFIMEAQQKLIVAGGWNRKVMVWRDESSTSSALVEPTRVMAGHNEDILSVAYSPPNLLATSGYDGRLLVWNMDSGILKFVLVTPNVEHLDVDQRAMWKITFLEKRSQVVDALAIQNCASSTHNSDCACARRLLYLLPPMVAYVSGTARKGA